MMIMGFDSLIFYFSHFFTTFLKALFIIFLNSFLWSYFDVSL